MNEATQNLQNQQTISQRLRSLAMGEVKSPYNICDCITSLYVLAKSIITGKPIADRNDPALADMYCNPSAGILFDASKHPMLTHAYTLLRDQELVDSNLMPKPEVKELFMESFNVQSNSTEDGLAISYTYKKNAPAA
jgi:hypothetical protein